MCGHFGNTRLCVWYFVLDCESNEVTDLHPISITHHVAITTYNA